MDKKILIIGARDFPKVDCFRWDEENLPNIADYDIVILNVVSLLNYKARASTQPKVKNGLEILLNSGGCLIAIGCPLKDVEVRTFPFGDKDIGSQSNYAWCPFQIGIKNESGDTVEFQDDTFKEYFKYVKKWTYFFDLRDSNLSIDNSVNNRYGKLLAGTIVRITSKGRTGELVFLPCPTEISDIEAVNFILEKFFRVYQKTPPPDWTKLVEVPGLKTVQKNIETNLQKIKQLSKKNEKFRETESELISYRELLYETGTALEWVVRKVFTKLGFKPKPPVYKEEYIIEYDKKVGIIECKGNEKSIKRDDFRQLFEQTKEYELVGKVEHKGILIGNAWRLKPLEERDKSGTPIFPKGKDGVTDIAARHDIALVSTTDLFKTFCKFLEGRIEANGIMKKIFSAKGTVNFYK